MHSPESPLVTPYEKRAINWLLGQLGLAARCVMPGRPPLLSDDQRAEIHRLAAQTADRAALWRELAAKYGVSARTIRRCARQNERSRSVDTLTNPTTVTTRGAR